MKCVSPNYGCFDLVKNETNFVFLGPVRGREYLFSPSMKYAISKAHDFSNLIILPCQKCVACRANQAREWAVRACHEAQMHEDVCVLTLTYDDVHVPTTHDGFPTLKHEDFQKFMRRLRKRFPHRKPRYLMCGEYGDKFSRPHYHVILFGFRFGDIFPWKRKKGKLYYRSKTLEDLWPFGQSLVDDNFSSGAGFYIAGYIMKKRADFKYAYEVDAFGREVEYMRMSNQAGGIGKSWFMKYKKEVLAAGLVRVPGNHKYTIPIPRYYLKLLQYDDAYYVDKKLRSKLSKAGFDVAPLSVFEKRAFESFEYVEFSKKRREAILKLDEDFLTLYQTLLYQCSDIFDSDFISKFPEYEFPYSQAACDARLLRLMSKPQVRSYEQSG